MISSLQRCFYLDEFLCKLSFAAAECHIGNLFVGAIAYADDIVVTAPTATALHSMLDI